MCLSGVRVFKGPARLLDQLLEEGRLRDDAHGALAEFLDGLGDNEHLLAVDPAVPRVHPAARYGLENSPSLISNRASIPQGMSPTPRNTRANDLSRSTSLTSTPQRVSSAVAPAGPAPTTRTFTRQTPIRTVVAPKIYPSVSDWERAPTLQVFIARSAANYLSIMLDVAVNPTFWGLIIAVFL